MKKKIFVCIVSVFVAIFSLITSVSADTVENLNCDYYDDNVSFEFEFSCVHDVECNENGSLNGRAIHGTCTHYGTVYFTNITRPSDYETKYLATISHHKASVNNCTEMMNWRIEFVILAASGPAVIHPPRVRTDNIAIGISQAEVFAGPFGTVFEWRFVTTVAGVTDKTEYKRIQF